MGLDIHRMLGFRKTENDCEADPYLIAHSAAETPCISPSGPIHMLAATGFTKK